MYTIREDKPVTVIDGWARNRYYILWIEPFDSCIIPLKMCVGHGDRALMEEPIFTAMAEKYGKSSVQIILRWHVQMGNQIIPPVCTPHFAACCAPIWST